MLRGSALVFLSRNFQKLMGALVAILLGWTAGDAGYGVYDILLVLLSWVGVLGGLGLGPAHVYLRGQGRLELPEVLGNALVASVVFGAACVAVFAAVSPYLELGNPVVAALITLAFPLVLLQGYLEYVWIGEDQMGVYSGLYALRFATFPPLLLLGVLLPGTADGRYVGIALALVANAALGVVVGLAVLRWRYGLRVAWRPRRFLDAARYGLSVQAGSFAQAVGYRFDRFLINGTLGLVAGGQYGMAVRFSEILWLLPGVLSTVLLPRVSTSDDRQAKALTARTCRVVFATSLLGGVAVWFLAAPLLRLVFDTRFDGAIWPLRLLLFGIVVFSVQKVLANYFIGQGRARWFQRATLLSMAVNLGLNLWLIPHPEWFLGGIRGAAFASSVSYTLSTAILAYFFLRWSGVGWRGLLAPNREDVAGALVRLRSVRARLGGLRGATR